MVLILFITQVVLKMGKQLNKLVFSGLLLGSVLSLIACTSGESEDKTALKELESSNSDFSYVAYGNEPDWSIVVSEDNKLTFSTPDQENDVVFEAQRSVYAKGSEYSGEKDGKAFYLNLNGNACEDTMSGESYDMTATFEFDGQTYKGCAKVQ